MGYTASVIKGLGWLSVAKIMSRGFALVKVALVARIVGPGEFGTFGVVAMAIALFETMTETGINIVIIRKQNGEELLPTALSVSVFRGILIGGLIAAAAVPLSIFFNNEELVGYILFSAIIPLIKGWINPALALFQKRLEFHKDTALRTSVIFIDALAGIIFVMIFRNIWGLLFGFLVAAVAEVILTWIYCPVRPKIGLNKQQLKELFGFSKWFNLVAISDYLSAQLDTILVGKVLGMAPLGLYQSAYKISHAPIVEVANLTTHSTFPVYSRFQNDLGRVMRGYTKVGLISASITGAIVLGLIIFRVPVILLAFGPEWLTAAEIVPILALAAWARSLIAPASAVILSINRPDWLARVSGIRFVVMGLAAIFLLQRYGILGMAYCVLLGNLASLPLLWHSIRSVTRDSTHKS